MEKVFTGELLKLLGLLGLGAFSLMAVMGRLVGKIRGSFTPYLKVTVFYLLLSTFVFGMMGFLGHVSIFSSPTIALIVLQLLCISIGIVHIWFMPRLLGWATGENTFLLRLLFTLVLAVFGFMLFIIVFKWINSDGYHYMAGAAILFFIIPLLVFHTFLKAIDIPPKIFKQWYYPLQEEVQEPDDDKLKNMLVISFEFQKKLNEPHFTNFRAKAPRDMEFGQLFYYFINDYNERHPNGKIEFADRNMEAYGWIFYRKPRWYSISTIYIDAEKTFYANRIRENDVIVCRRSLNI